MKFFVVIKRESRKGIILRVQREKAAIPWGYQALEGLGAPGMLTGC